MDRYYDFSKRTVLVADELQPRHSEASIIELRDGSLLMAWQCHQKSKFGSRDEAPSVIALMNSSDDGKTWHNERVAARMIEGSVNVYSPSLIRNSDGSISLFFKRYMQLEKGKPVLNNFYRIRSYDEGASWSEEESIWTMNDYGAMNHSAKRISDGAMLIPLEGGSTGWLVRGEPEKIVVLRSEDDMKTFSESNKITLPKAGAMEPCIAEMQDGRLNMVLRTQLGSVFVSESLDGGRSWSKPQTTGLRAPESCSCIVSIPNSDAQLVMWNNSEYDMFWRSHYGKRTPLTMAISRDGLKTFSDFYDLETDPNRAFTNPSVTVTSKGIFVVNYWTCEYTEEGLFGPLIDLKIATFKINI